MAKMNFDIVGFKEQAADAAEATDQHLGALPWRSRWWAFPGKPVGVSDAFSKKEERLARRQHSYPEEVGVTCTAAAGG